MLNPISGKYSIRYESSEFCYVIEALDTANRIRHILDLNVPKVLRLMMKKMNMNYRQVAEFCNLDRSNKVFRLAYTTHLGNHQLDDMTRLNQYLTIDTDSGTAKFFHHDHKPDAVPDTHIGPVIRCTEESNLPVTERVPIKVTTRVVIEDPLERILTMSLTPTNGYLLGVNDLNLCSPNTAYVISGAAPALNDLLRRIHFVGVAAGSGKIEIKVNDNEAKENSEAVANVTLNIAAGVKVSIPTLTVPEEAIVAPLKVDTKITPAITVADDDNKLLSLRIYPYNCEVYGWKSYGGYISYGQNRVTIGRPEVINNDIANLFVRTQATNAQLGLELVCGKTMIRDYVIFDVSETEEPEEPVIPELTVNNLSGNESDEIALGASFSTEGVTEPVSLTITATNCTIKNYGSETINSGSPKSDTGDVATINGKLATSKVVLGSTSGTIKFDWNGDKTKSITVTVTPASVIPTLTANKIMGNPEQQVALGARFSTEGVTADQSVTLTPNGCKLTALPDVENSSDAVTLEGKIAAINEALAAAKVIIGSGNGKVTFSWNGGKNTQDMQVEVQQQVPVSLAETKQATTSKKK